MNPKRVRTLKPASRKPLKAPMFESQQPLDDFDAQMAQKNMVKIRFKVYTATISANCRIRCLRQFERLIRKTFLWFRLVWTTDYRFPMLQWLVTMRIAWTWRFEFLPLANVILLAKQVRNMSMVLSFLSTDLETPIRHRFIFISSLTVGRR